jgi:phosphoribosylanthranilate isomerase
LPKFFRPVNAAVAARRVVHFSGGQIFGPALGFWPMTRVKICGITRLEDALAAADAGADAVGFILHPSSKRSITPEKAAAILEKLPPYLTTVAVTVNVSQAGIEEFEKTVSFDVWQMHGEETPLHCRALAPRRVVKSVSFPGVISGEQTAAYAVSGFLLDKASAARGGTGEVIDWTEAAAFCRRAGKPCILAGGLNPNNVVRAVETVQPFAVDVSSGVESAPGIKDPRLIKEFVNACRSL